MKRKASHQGTRDQEDEEDAEVNGESTRANGSLLPDVTHFYAQSILFLFLFYLKYIEAFKIRVNYNNKAKVSRFPSVL